MVGKDEGRGGRLNETRGPRKGWGVIWRCRIALSGQFLVMLIGPYVQLLSAQQRPLGATGGRISLQSCASTAAPNNLHNKRALPERALTPPLSPCTTVTPPTHLSPPPSPSLPLYLSLSGREAGVRVVEVPSSEVANLVDIARGCGRYPRVHFILVVDHLELPYRGAAAPDLLGALAAAGEEPGGMQTVHACVFWVGGLPVPPCATPSTHPKIRTENPQSPPPGAQQFPPPKKTPPLCVSVCVCVPRWFRVAEQHAAVCWCVGHLHGDTQ